jgi:hypothetical protein
MRGYAPLDQMAKRPVITVSRYSKTLSESNTGLSVAVSGVWSLESYYSCSENIQRSTCTCRLSVWVPQTDLTASFGGREGGDGDTVRPA